MPLDGGMVFRGHFPNQVTLLLRKLGTEELSREKSPHGLVNSSRQTEHIQM